MILYCLAKHKNYLKAKAAAAVGFDDTGSLKATDVKVYREILDFSIQKLSEEDSIADFDWKDRNFFSTTTTKLDYLPKDSRINKLSTLYWNKYEVEFRDAIKKHSKDGEDPWTSEEVLDKAEDWFKIGCGIMLLTLDDIQSHINEALLIYTNQSEARARANIKYRLMYDNCWYAKVSLCYFWRVYTFLKLGVSWNDDTGQLCLPEDVSLNHSEIVKNRIKVSSIIIEGRSEFYKKGTRQEEWKKLYNDCCLILNNFFKEAELEKNPLVSSDKDKHQYKAWYMSWLT